jgi:two-component system osmolarity sensor histidine kinase EnvZ
MLRSLSEMAGIIDQFIDYARMDGGEEVREVNLAQLLCDCADKYAAEGRAISADTRSAPAILARPQSIRRAVENLIENAYRYGGSKVSIECAPLAAGVRISVLDRGPGIADEERDAVTKPFARGSNSIDTPGAGLGLAIVARVAQVHRGSLELLPREGGGLEARLNLLLLLP